MQLEFAGWEFLRVMAELEASERRTGARARQSFYSHYRALYAGFDAEVETLAAAGEAARERYTRRMRTDVIEIRPPAPALALEVIHALGRLVNRAAGELRKGTPDAAERTRLQYELRELKALRARCQTAYDAAEAPTESS